MAVVSLFVIQWSEGAALCPLTPGMRFPAMLPLPGRGRSLVTDTCVSGPAMVSTDKPEGK